MNYFETAGAGAYVTVATYTNSFSKLRLLLTCEIKKPQRNFTGVIRNVHEQAATTAINRFTLLHFTADQAAIARPNFAEAGKAGAIFIAKREQKKQVLNPERAKTLKRPGKRRPNTLQFSEWCR
jgi:hypothetical protein